MEYIKFDGILYLLPLVNMLPSTTFGIHDTFWNVESSVIFNLILFLI